MIRLERTHPADPAPTMMCEKLFCPKNFELVERLGVDEKVGENFGDKKEFVDM